MRLHYREADQNREWWTLGQRGGRSGEYTFRVDTTYLDELYDLISYVEVIDVLGSGSFCPDPFAEARYWVCRGEGIFASRVATTSSPA